MSLFRRCGVVAMIMIVASVVGCVTGPKPLASGIREIEIKAWQWGYSPNLITTNMNEIVRLKIVSLDVEHSLICPELGVDVKIPAKGNAPVVYDLKPFDRGDYILYCGEDCGPGQSKMKLRMIVMP